MCGIRPRGSPKLPRAAPEGRNGCGATPTGTPSNRAAHPTESVVDAGRGRYGLKIAATPSAMNKQPVAHWPHFSARWPFITPARKG